MYNIAGDNGCMLFCCMNRLICLLAIANNATENILVCVFWWMYALVYLGHMPQSGIAG